MMMRRLHASIFVILLPVVLMRLCRDQQRLREYVQFPSIKITAETLASIAQLSVLDASNLLAGEMDQTKQGDSVGAETDNAIDEKVLEPPRHQSVSSIIDMNDLDSSKPATCGFIKCYFGSKSDSQVNDRVHNVQKDGGATQVFDGGMGICGTASTKPRHQPLSLGSSNKRVCYQRDLF